MNKSKRKIISAMLIAIIMFASIIAPLTAARAYELPNAFWSMNKDYEAALNSENYNDIIKYGKQIVELIGGEEENDQTIKILSSRLYEIAFSYYLLNDYDSALEYFQKYLPYGRKLESNDDGIKIAENFVMQLTPTLDVYKLTPNETVYYGAKNEPHGVLLGEVSESVKEHDSMILLYLEYGDTYFDWARKIFKDARANNQVIELALNYVKEGDDARTISAGDSYLAELKAFVSEFTDVPVLLRIGAEVNIWTNPCTPEEFIPSFKAIASVMRELPNVATVWSVAHTSDWTRISSDFYPGDEYVDWVGVNAYPTKYFTGRRLKGKSVFNEVVFKTGYSADPVLEVKEIIDEFGDRKPIMIAECGAAYHTGGEINEEYPEWGVEQLKNLYGLIPMVYPQVKLMAYFNTRVPNEINYYDFRNCKELEKAYMDIKTSPWFIRDSGQNSAQGYFEKVSDSVNTDGTVTLGAYPRLFGSDTIEVNYYIDDKPVSTANQAPYTVDLTVSAGTHTLKVAAKGNNGATLEKTFTIASSLAAGAASEQTEESDANTMPEEAKNSGDDISHSARPVIIAVSSIAGIIFIIVLIVLIIVKNKKNKRRRTTKIGYGTANVCVICGTRLYGTERLCANCSRKY